jgi:hypothetical protein
MLFEGAAVLEGQGEGGEDAGAIAAAAPSSGRLKHRASVSSIVGRVPARSSVTARASASQESGFGEEGAKHSAKLAAQVERALINVGGHVAHRGQLSRASVDADPVAAAQAVVSAAPIEPREPKRCQETLRRQGVDFLFFFYFLIPFLSCQVRLLAFRWRIKCLLDTTSL